MALDNFLLSVEFDDGQKVIYDVRRILMHCLLFDLCWISMDYLSKFIFTRLVPASIGMMRSILPAIIYMNMVGFYNRLLIFELKVWL